MPRPHLRVLLLLLACLPLVACETTTPGDRLPSAAGAFSWTLDEVEDDLADAREALARLEPGEDRDRLTAQLQEAESEARTLRAELDAGIAAEDVEVLDRLYQALMELVQRATAVRTEAVVRAG